MSWLLRVLDTLAMLPASLAQGSTLQMDTSRFDGTCHVAKGACSVTT